VGLCNDEIYGERSAETVEWRLSLYADRLRWVQRVVIDPAAHICNAASTSRDWEYGTVD